MEVRSSKRQSFLPHIPVHYSCALQFLQLHTYFTSYKASKWYYFFNIILLGYKLCHSLTYNISQTTSSCNITSLSRSRWPRGLRRRSAAARQLKLWVRIPPGAWVFVCCDCCVLSGRGLCDGLITLPEEAYRLWCVVVCDEDTSRTRRP